MKISEIPKFLINLERRPDRLERVKKELDYIGWDYTVYKAIDTNGHDGLSKTTLEIIKIAKERKYPRVMLIEDDIRFMPYAKDLISKIDSTCSDLKFAIFNLAPTLNRPVNRSDKYEFLLDITNLPPKEEHHRDIFATNMIIYDESIYDKIFEIQSHPSPFYYPIDEFNFRYIISNYQSYSPILPIAPQGKEYSNISHGEYSTFYAQTYNWNGYSPCKIPNEYRDESSNEEIKLNNTHKDFYYVS
jgi:hypothetical protein